MNEALLILGGTVFTALVGFFGVRATASKSAKASSESVGVTALTAAMNAWQAQAQRTDAELQLVKTDLRDTKAHYDTELEKLKRLLSASRQYIAILLAGWRAQFPDVDPPKPPAGYTHDEDD